MASRSRIGMSWASRKASENYKYPLCGSAVRYCRVRGNLKPQIECIDPKCSWILDDMIHENSVRVIQDTKPKGISSRQWYEATRAVSQ